MIKRYSKFIFLSILIMTLVGCATIIHGGRQKIPVKSYPSGATVSVNMIKVETPGVINLSRSEPMVILRFEKDGYEPVEVTLIRTTDGWIWGNLFIGGLIGIAIDYSTGAAYQLSPNAVNVTLKSLGYGEKKESQPAKEQVEEVKKEERADEGKVVAIDVLSRPSSYSEYYRLLYKTIVKNTVISKDVPGGAINAGVNILSDGTLESVEILGNSSEDPALREAVMKAVKDSAPFPPFPSDIKEGRKAFTIMIEHRQNR
ncbi:MAG: TonB family protein [Candidatus Omnitrophota bacterium]|nr:TonB family protein [Candidatus Omnitrophota bacterium]